MAKKTSPEKLASAARDRKPAPRGELRGEPRGEVAYSANTARNALQEFPFVAHIACADTLAAALEVLRLRDPEIVDKMLAFAGPPPLRLRPPDFSGLASIIISQQVSTASANAIFARFSKAFPHFDARLIGAADDADLRACGLSAPKIRTLRAIAEAINAGALDLASLAAMDAAAAHARLTAIHGIGPWSADIFLLFCLGHPDAWPVGDLALQEAARKVLGLRARPTAKQLEKIGDRWRPVRGVAARLLWAWYGARRPA